MIVHIINTLETVAGEDKILSITQIYILEKTGEGGGEEEWTFIFFIFLKSCN